MSPEKEPKEFQTTSVFIILAVLTVTFVLGLRLVLFAPTVMSGLNQDWQDALQFFEQAIR